MPPAKKICVDEGETDEKWIDDIDHEIEQHKVGKCFLEGNDKKVHLDLNYF